MPLGIRGRLLAEVYILLRRKLVPSGLECCALRVCMGSYNKKREQQESSRYREWRSVDQDWPVDFLGFVSRTLNTSSKSPCGVGWRSSFQGYFSIRCVGKEKARVVGHPGGIR